jgi:hypothetical protein
MNENNNHDSYVDDLKKALGYSLSIIIAMWIISMFIN